MTKRRTGTAPPPLPAECGDWDIGEKVTDGDLQDSRTYRITCRKCGRVEIKSERWIRNGLSARQATGRNRSTGCRTCHKNRVEIPTGLVAGTLWTVTGSGVLRAHKTGSQLYYPVRCECGRTAEVQGNSLRNGHSGGCRSCTNRAARKKRKD